MASACRVIALCCFNPAHAKGWVRRLEVSWASQSSSVVQCLFDIVCDELEFIDFRDEALFIARIRFHACSSSVRNAVNAVFEVIIADSVSEICVANAFLIG